jgi:hypothetical protein
MKIKSGLGFNAALVAEGLLTDTGMSFMYMFSGTMPTQAQVLAAMTGGSALYTNYGGTVDFTKLMTSLPDAVPLVYCRYASGVTPVYQGPDHFTLPLTATSEQGIVINAGTPTWFMYGVYHTSVNANFYAMQGGTTVRPDNTGGTLTGLTVFGSVGNENSTADMKVVGGTVTAGTPYKFLDLDITINSPA